MNKKNDMFANIASMQVDLENRSLVEPQPVEKADIALPFSNSTIIFNPNQKMTTEEQLEAELIKQRAYYKPFMQDLAPALKANRTKVHLTEFDWRKQEREDCQNFQRILEGEGNWERVQVPHYGEPLGVAVTYYRTVVTVVKEMFELGSLFMCFKGVDYKTSLFINDVYCGSHEGFFAPFEFDITDAIKEGENIVIVKVENDYTQLGSIDENSNGKRYDGDKIYAATGLGYDDPEIGWHHCPPAMGIYQDVYLESRSRVFIQDIFIRPMPNEEKAEAWIEVFNCDAGARDISINLSVYGQNFEQTVIEDLEYEAVSDRAIGVGDSLNETLLRAAGLLGKPVKLFIEKGKNYIKVPIEMKKPRIWEPQTPWLYQVQVKLIDESQSVIDMNKRQFGMRTFEIDTETIPKGNFYLNNRQIRLRGANTMGHEQQCVYKKDWDQLRDDLLLAKICNMNFLRLTQRPVQPEIYDYCDQLGLMTQTDFPLFGKLRINQFCEALRQVEEMEKLIRSHPCNVVVSYINEPFPNADNKPHRNLSRKELMNFFTAADLIVKMHNPDRVIKHVDGDYDPPSVTLPDNHCYNIWYNGNGVDIGKLSKGYWLPIKPDWNFGCGEFGAEGLDPACLMRERYPKEWLPQTEDEDKTWSPNQIIGAQTGKFHYCFFETPEGLENWVIASRAYQGRAVKSITEAFRRDKRMVTCAIHLFIDAFPAGWMKTIMDCERRPKPAYFAYREALTPLMVSLRTDNYKYFEDHEAIIGAWICNDTTDVPENASLQYYIQMDGEVIVSGETTANIPNCSAEFQGGINFKVPAVSERKHATVHLGLVSDTGELLHDTELGLELFPKVALNTTKKFYAIGDKNGRASTLVKEIGGKVTAKMQEANVIVIDDYDMYQTQKDTVHTCINNGANAIFLELPEGEYTICDSIARVKFSTLLPMHFVSRDTGHPIVQEFRPNDFAYWYDENVDYITPIIANTFVGDDFMPILTSGNTNDQGEWDQALAVGEKVVGKGRVSICQVNLTGRTRTNPISKLFVKSYFDL